MPSEKNALIETTPAQMAAIAHPGDRSEPEASMSYAMITIGAGIGHLAATVFSTLARGLRILSASTRASGSRSSHPRRRLAEPRRESYGV